MISATEFIAGSILIISAGWIASPAADRHFRNLFPRPALFLLFGAIAIIIATAVAITTTDYVAIIAGIPVMCFVIGRAIRSALGRRLGEPPGSRSVISSIRDLGHRDTYARRFENHGPINLSTQFGRTIVCILGIERGQRLLREHRSAIGPSPLAFSQQMMGGFLRYMDDSTHDFYGPLFRRAMSRSVTDSCLPLIAEIARAEFGLEHGESTDPRLGAARLTETVLLRALFGVDPYSAFGREFLLSLRSFRSHAINHRGNRRARRDLEVVRSLTHRALDDPASSTQSSALHDIRLLQPDQPDATSIDNLLFMWKIGSANTASLLTWAFQHIGENPAIRARLGAQEQGLAEAVVMESLRLSQSEYVYRRLKSGVEFDGFRLRKGWGVRICVAESHLDAENFSCPHEFTDRFLEHRPSQSVYSPFGFDRHACNASGLASAIVAASLNEIFSQTEIEVIPSRVLQRAFRHWSHWQPGSDLVLTRARR